jgi:uncharacterized protein
MVYSGTLPRPGEFGVLIDRMTRTECDELFARVGFGRLACALDNQPYIVPLYFGHQPDHLYGFATFGQKIAWMRANPLVCVQADEVLGPEDWACVIAFGRYEELPDTPEHSHDRIWAQSVLERRSSWWQPAYAASQVRRHPHEHFPIFYRINIREISGLRATPGERIVETWRLKS